MTKEKEIFHTSPHFGEMSKEELNLYLDFLAKVMFNLDGFEVWEAENIFSEEDDSKWNEEATWRYKKLIQEKIDLQNKVYGNF